MLLIGLSRLVHCPYAIRLEHWLNNWHLIQATVASDSKCSENPAPAVMSVQAPVRARPMTAARAQGLCDLWSSFSGRVSAHVGATIVTGITCSSPLSARAARQRHAQGQARLTYSMYRPATAGSSSLPMRCVNCEGERTKAPLLLTSARELLVVIKRFGSWGGR